MLSTFIGRGLSSQDCLPPYSMSSDTSRARLADTDLVPPQRFLKKPPSRCSHKNCIPDITRKDKMVYTMKSAAAISAAPQDSMAQRKRQQRPRRPKPLIRIDSHPDLKQDQELLRDMEEMEAWSPKVLRFNGLDAHVSVSSLPEGIAFDDATTELSFSTVSHQFSSSDRSLLSCAKQSHCYDCSNNTRKRRCNNEHFFV